MPCVEPDNDYLCGRASIHNGYPLNSDMLINTKLQTAQLNSSMLLREPLINRLCVAKGYPLILISGPAGSGKSSLACQWIRREKLNVAWYSLDAEDNEPDLFYRYLLTALAQSDAQLHKAFNPMLECRQKFTGDNIIGQLIKSVCALSRNIHLVLDDFHQITSAEIQAALARLIYYIPANLHLVILSRYDLPAPIDTVVAQKEKLVLSASDLKFTEKETAEFYKKIMGIYFSPKQIRDVNRCVEGWAAGLHLIGLSLRSQGDISNLSSILKQTSDQVANYLIHDILRMQPEKIRDFVFATALLDRFTPELCAEITGCGDASRIIAHLERLNLFLIPLDDDRKWYRYHHIFSEVVRGWVAVENSDLIPQTLRLAALWLTRNNHLEDALRCAFQCDDLEFAADLMEEHILTYVETFDLAAGLRWITKLPENILNQRPLLQLQQCGFLFILMELSDLKEVLRGMETSGKPDLSRYPAQKRDLCQDYAAYLKCMLHILYAKDRFRADHIEALRDKFRPQNPLLVSAVETQIVSILILQGELALAEDLLAGLTGLSLSKPNYILRKKIYQAKAKTLIAQHRGRLHKAEAIILKVQQTLNGQGYGNSPMAFLLHRHLGSIYYLQNRLDEAWKCAAKVMKFRECEYFGLFDETRAGSELLMQLHRAAGEYDQAFQCIRQMYDYSFRLGMPQIAACADACAAQLAIDRDSPAAAELWSKRRKLQPDELFSLLFATECLTQARLYYAQKKYLQAANLLQSLRNRCLKRGLADLVLQIDILQSATLHAMNQRETAVALLKKTLAFAETEGYLRPFINDSKLIAPILRFIADRSSDTPAAGNIEKILILSNLSRHGADPVRKCDGRGQGALTQREIEILEWVAQGFQNKEIARNAFIAVSTVKSHIRHIMTKLNATTRIQMVVKAKEIGILPHH